MLKNLIVIPLESVSNMILWQYRMELSTVWRMLLQSFFYTRFYSGSVSTESVLKEFMNGCSDTFDGLSLYRERSDSDHPWIQNNPKQSHLEQLTRHLGYAQLFPFEDYFNPPKRIGPWVGDCDVDALFATTKKELTEARAQGKPVFLFFRMSISHMAFDDRIKIQAATFSDRFRLGFLQLDRAVNRLLATLMELEMWEDSVIVFFGDHGDELWSHGLNKGFCHGIHPYASLNWTPLFIYENGQPPGMSHRLVSTIDLRESLLNRLAPGFEPTHYGPPGLFSPFRQTVCDGIDAFNEERDLAFSQNLYALQLEYSDFEKGLTKGYSVTDGVYRVVVASGGRDPRNGGMEFFHDRIDPANVRNLLDFFKLDANGDLGKFTPPLKASESDFLLTFNEQAVAHMRGAYNKLKTALYEHIREKEKRGLQFASGPHHTMPESVFRHARRRLSRD